MLSVPAPAHGGSLRRALLLARHHARPVVVVLLLTLFSRGLGAVQPWLFGRFVDDLATPSSALLAMFGGLVALEILRETTSAVGSWLTWRTRITLQQELLGTAVRRLQRVPLSFHRQQGIGETMTVVDRGINGFVNALSELALSVIPSAVYLVVAVVVMVRLEPRLAAVVCLLAPLPVIVGVLAAPEQTRREQDLMGRWSRLYGRFHEVLGGILTVRSFGMEEVEEKRFVQGIEAANAVVVRGLTRDTWVNALRSVLAVATGLVALGYGGWLVARGETSVGTVLSFTAYVGALFGPVQGLTGAWQTLSRARVSVDAIFEILDTEDDPPDPEVAVPLPERVRGEVRFEGVTFRYAPSAPPALADLDLHVRAGERVALVGPSGSGKTTLVSLLERLHDPSAGRILLDGHDLRELDPRALRRTIGVVLQDGVLFNDTVRANIAYGRPDATLDQIRDAARAAHAEEFVERLPDGWDTVLGQRGSLLSVGQRQRIAIARALLKDPPILVLDEATSALDADSEAVVQDALDTLLCGRTSFVIAHRLVTTVGADRILVLEHGRIVEQGTHLQLLARCGVYARLVAKQMRGLSADFGATTSF